jgi:hypothetical protein
MVVTPGLIPVATPAAVIVATEGSDDAHDTGSPVTSAPVELRALAENACD